jgi:LysR family transcriptional regulator, transcriptional activator for aaeXAB operon
MALAGVGIARQPRPGVKDEIKSGRLIKILPEWPVPAIGVYAVTPQRDAQPAKVRHAIEDLRRYLSA